MTTSTVTTGEAPLVTVFLTTYNHGRFVAEALDSVLAQETAFDVSVVVLEDCSTDNTRTIVKDYQRRAPDRIRLVLNATNLCSNAPLARELAACHSPYAAFLDGDDYWTSPLKLQKQVDFLEAHPECAICYHQVTILHEDGSRLPWTWRHGEQKPVSTLRDLLLGNFIPGCSPMIRRPLVERLPAWFDESESGDWPLYIMYAHHGTIGYLPENLGVYRVHSGGIWAGADAGAQLRHLIRFFHELEGRLDDRWRPLLHQKIAEWTAALGTLGPTSAVSPWTPPSAARDPRSHPVS
jgi:glycosyltransferase involved in cell wall biosynthesis